MNGHINIEFKESDDNSGIHAWSDINIEFSGRPLEDLTEKAGLLSIFLSSLNLTELEYMLLKDVMVERSWPGGEEPALHEDPAKDFLIFAALRDQEVEDESRCE